MIIGICGKSGSGKSTLARQIAREYNGIYLDIDEIGHKVLELDEVKRELVKSFGDNIFSDNSIDRKKLGDIVFNSRCEMKKLSDTTWKYMQIEIDKVIDSNKESLIVLDWILLPITKYFNLCNLRILLDVPYEVRKERAMRRDNITSESFDLREKASIDFKVSDFDYVINDSDEEMIRKLVQRL